MVDFRGLKTCIYGIQGSGKTHFAKNMYKQFQKPLVYAVNKDDDWDNLPNIYVYKPESRLGAVKEFFDVFIKQAHKWAMEGKIDAVIIDEADLFFQTNWSFDPYMTDFVLNHRHLNESSKGNKGIALWLITRRPQDIPTKIAETAQYNIIFKLEAYNAIQRFKELHPVLPEMIEKLDYKKHNFVFKELGKDPYIHAPLKT